jgi:serine/threonine-protein kinase
MGAVWVAVRRGGGFKQQVAVKLMHRDLVSEDLVRRFRTERQILAAIDHPNIARMLDGGTADDGSPYFAMELIDGQRIDDYCDAKSLPIGERLVLFQSVCAAVHFAHQNLVVHRDIKPGNILVTNAGIPKLLDFGIAKLLSPMVVAGTMEVTRSHQRIMTPEYASPEQISGRPITTATDIYSLGVLLYKLLTGNWPYRIEPGRAHDISRVICEEEPIPPSTAVSRSLDGINSGREGKGTSPESVGKVRSSSIDRLRRELAGDLDTIVLTALRKEPQNRYASAEQLSDDVERYLNGHPIRAQPSSTFYRASKFVRRHRLGVMMSAASLVAVVVFAVTMAVQRDRIEAERDRAETALRRAEEVSAFLEETLGSANPYEGKGRDITVVEVLDDAVPRISQSFADHPETGAALKATIGGTYLRLGRFDEAEPLLREAFATRREISNGKDHPDLATSMEMLANLLRRTAEYGEAEALYRESLAMRRRLYGEKHPEVATILHDLGTVRDRQSDYDQAESYYRKALEMRRATLGRRHENVAESQNALANVLRRKGMYNEAENLYLDSLALRRDVFGERHPEVAQSLANLGFLYYTMSDFERAEPLFRQSLEIRQAVLGNEHPETARGMANLARLLRKTGRLEEAEPLYQEALAIRRSVHGEMHPEIATSLNDLATLYTSKGDYAAAEPLYRRSLAIRRELLGDEHWYVAMSLNNLAVLLNRTGRTVESEPLYREAVRIMITLRGDRHPDVATAMTNLAGVLMKMESYDEAESLQLEALDIRRSTFGDRHPETRRSYRLLAFFYDARGRAAEAAAYRRLVEETSDQ